jgi:outer membrane protein TolC
VQSQLQIHDLSDEVSALQRARDTLRQQYLAGASSLTDVLDAQRELLVAEG